MMKKLLLKSIYIASSIAFAFILRLLENIINQNLKSIDELPTIFY